MTSKGKTIAALFVIVLSILPPAGPLTSPVAGEEEDSRQAIPQQPSPYLVGSTVIGSAGSPGASTSYTANGTLGQPTPIGTGTAGEIVLQAGFWGGRRMATGTEEVPPAFRLFQNYPNPFNPVTTVEFSVANPCVVDLAIYDVGGRKIKRLVHDKRAPGRYREFWDGTNERGAQVAAGLYFYRLRAGTFESVKKMVLIR